MIRNMNFVGVPASLVKSRSELSSVDLMPQLIEWSAAVTVTSGALAYVYGSWIELIASSAEDSTYISVNSSDLFVSGADSSGLIDIGIGSSGSEQVLISSVPCGYSLNGNGLLSFFPIFIPKGSRLSVRRINRVPGDPHSVTIGLYKDQTGRSPKFIDTYGANIVTSSTARGTNMPTSDTYVQITSSTTRPYKALMMLPVAGGTSSFGVTERSTYTLAIGQSGSEKIIATMPVDVNANEYIFSPLAGLPGFSVGHFPAGTRISCKQSIGRTFRDVIVYGVPYA